MPQSKTRKAEYQRERRAMKSPEVPTSPFLSTEAELSRHMMAGVKSLMKSPKRCKCCNQTDEERREALQWGIDHNRITVREDVMKSLGLVKPIWERVNEKLGKLDNFKGFGGVAVRPLGMESDTR